MYKRREYSEYIINTLSLNIPGRPHPKVEWYADRELLSKQNIVLGKEGTILESQETGLMGRTLGSGQFGDINNNYGPGFGFREGSGPPYVVAKLTIHSLNRNHSNVKLICKAENNNITAPIERSISLTVYCK